MEHFHSEHSAPAYGLLPFTRFHVPQRKAIFAIIGKVFDRTWADILGPRQRQQAHPLPSSAARLHAVR